MVIMGSGRTSSFMATRPPPMIRVTKPTRSSSFETILEENFANLPSEAPCPESLANSNWAEGAPAPVTREKKQAFQSSLDTICEETMTHYMAEYFHVSDAAAGAILRTRPDFRFNHFENLSLNHFCVDRAAAGAQ